MATKIVNLKIREEYLDEEKSDKRKKICDEIIQFHALKTKWGLGSVFSKPLLIPCQHGCRKWYGKYVDLEGWERRAFLAFEIDMAIKRCNHVKSFIYNS